MGNNSVSCRAKAVRLIANKLLPEIALTAAIERFATGELQKLTKLGPNKRKKVDNAMQPAPLTQKAVAEAVSERDMKDEPDDENTKNGPKRQRELVDSKVETGDVKSESESSSSKRQRTDGPELSSDRKSDPPQANGHATKGALLSFKIHLHPAHEAAAIRGTFANGALK